MKFKKIYLVLVSIPYFISVNAHQTDCFERNTSHLSRPCVERLVPRALNVVDRSMIEPSPIKVIDTLLGDPKQPLVAVLGATGRTGRYVLTELSSRGARIRALSRNIEKAQSSANGNYNWMRADVTEPDTLIKALKDVDILISVIGAEERKGKKSSESVSYQGSINFVEAAKKTGIKHIIFMSSIGAGGADNFSTVLLNLVLGKTMKWKSLGEEYIRNSGINFTIVRPGGLRGDSGALGIKLAQGDKIIGWIPRADVASVLVESAFNENAFDKTFEIINDDSLEIDAWRGEFKNLKKGTYGKIATGNIPLNYWIAMLLIMGLIVYLIRRRRSH